MPDTRYSSKLQRFGMLIRRVFVVLNKRKSLQPADVIICFGVGVVGLMSLLPLLNTLALSFSSSTMAASGKVTFFPLGFNLEAYRQIITDAQFYRSFGKSLERVIIGGAINFVLTILAAFPLSHSEKIFRGRTAYMWVLVVTMLFSGGLVPTYMLVSGLRLMDTVWALVLPGAVPVWNCILLINFFKNLPVELEEAAIIDGAQPYQIMMRIFLPVSLPALSTVTLFSLVGPWNDFFSGLIYINNVRNYPLATYISTIVSSMKDLTKITNPEELERLMMTNNTTVNSAKIFISMIPILCVYPFMQKYFIHGLVLGSVKG
jgi:ABC-type glycerol-3-phosphate transport system permease component